MKKFEGMTSKSSWTKWFPVLVFVLGMILPNRGNAQFLGLTPTPNHQIGSLRFDMKDDSWVAQTFTAVESGSFFLVSVNEIGSGLLPRPVLMQLRPVEDGLISEEVLASEIASVDLGEMFFRMLNNRSVFFEKDQKYALVLKAQGANSVSGRSLAVSNDNSYAGGEVWVRTGVDGEWRQGELEGSEVGSLDLFFGVFMDAGEVVLETATPANESSHSVNQPIRVTPTVVVDPLPPGGMIWIVYSEAIGGSQTHYPAEENLQELDWTPTEVGTYYCYLGYVLEDRSREIIKSHEVVVHVLNDTLTNDHYHQALLVSGSHIEKSVSNVSASFEPSEPRLGQLTQGRSVWYRWTAPDNGLCRVFGTAVLEGESSTSFVPAFGLFSGENLAGSRLLASTVLQEDKTFLEFEVSQGVEYRLSVDGQLGEQGTIDWELIFSPSNDLFERRTILIQDEVHLEGNNLNATSEAGESPIGTSGDLATVWYHWRAPVSGEVRLEVRADGFEPCLSLYQGGSLESLEEFETLCANGESVILEFSVLQGEDWMIRVGSPVGQEGTFHLDLSVDGLKFLNQPAGFLFREGIDLKIRFQFPFSLSEEEIEKMDIYSSGHHLTTLTRYPYDLTFGSLAQGNYQIQAVLTTRSGSVFSSALFAFHVIESEHIPQFRIFDSYSFNFLQAPTGEIFQWNGLDEDGLKDYLFFERGIFPYPGVLEDHFDPAHLFDYQIPRALPLSDGLFRWNDLIERRDIEFFVPILLAIDSAGRMFSFTRGMFPFRGLDESFSGTSKQIHHPIEGRRWVRFLSNDSGMATRILSDDGKLFLIDETGLREYEWPFELNDSDFYQFSTHFLYLGRGSRIQWFTGGGTFFLELIPEVEEGISGWKFIQENNKGVFGLTQEGRLFFWSNGAFELPGKLIPPPGEAGRWLSISIGNSHQVGLTDQGKLFSWGSDDQGQLGLGIQSPPTGFADPQEIPLPNGVNSWGYFCAVRNWNFALGDNCQLYGWGSNSFEYPFSNVARQIFSPQLMELNVDLCAREWIDVTWEQFLQPNGDIWLRFSTEENRRYEILYSSDMRTWKKAEVVVVGTGGFLTWVDSGPPKTETHPSEDTQRFYRVVRIQR